MTAKSHGLDDEGQSILEASGLTEDQVTIPTMGKPLSPPKPIVPTFRSNWPTKATSTTVFEEALMSQDEDAAVVTNGIADDEPDLLGEAQTNGDFADQEEVEDAAGWDMGDDAVPEPEEDFVEVEGPTQGAGSSEADVWSRSSPIAADHVAGGSFESAMQLLSRQVGAVNFDPLKDRFEEIYQASRTFLPANTGMPPLVNYVRRTVEETDPRRIQPIIPRNLELISSQEVTAGKKAMQGNKLEDGVRIFREILHSLLVNAVASSSEAQEARRISQEAARYALAMSLELERRCISGASPDLSSLSEDKRKRSLELSAYFTVPALDGGHQSLTWYAAMNLANRNKQHSSALSFANRLIDQSSNAKFKETARKVRTTCERNPTDAVEIDFDQFADFDICAASYTPIYSGSASVACPYCASKYHSKYKGTVCRICEVCQLGAPASGLKLFV